MSDRVFLGRAWNLVYSNHQAFRFESEAGDVLLLREREQPELNGEELPKHCDGIKEVLSAPENLAIINALGLLADSGSRAAFLVT